MMKKKCLIYFNSNFLLCSKRLYSTTIAQKLEDQKEYVPLKFTDVPINPQLCCTNSKQVFSKIKSQIPADLLTRKKSYDSLYLIDPLVARKVVAEILPYLNTNAKQVIAECHPGLGLITRLLLKKGIEPIKLFEPSESFRKLLKKLVSRNRNKLQLYSKNLLNLSKFNYSDRQDDGVREETLLKNVPKKGWTDDPALSIIGPLLSDKFLKYIINTIPNQTSLSSYGRTETFLIMKPYQYLSLSTEQDLYLKRYNYITVMFNLFFEYKLLTKLPRAAFLPWENIESCDLDKPHNTDKDSLYLVRAVIKKDLPLPFHDLLPFYCFMKKFFNRSHRIIPVLEVCVPGCGKHIIVPQLHHEDYFKHIGIFTEFRELTPNQILGVFREIHQHPNYIGSPLFEMVEAETVRTEKLESIYISEHENTLIDEIEDLDLDDHFLEEELHED